ncbi:MAG: hypothetical protein OXJ53_16755 [Gammaproteobacteria bacterium]|nr:hypothetical protein [Gammaproteobacteria bacterium]MDD9963299.1 hypothetical protein [Gammaproteobacteria bacterium]MDE0272880.1 hypothetical protein [Gammaproteobacteria bacterium]
MKHAIASVGMWALLGLASPAALAECPGPQTGEDYWNCECRQDWAAAPATSTCQTTDDGEPRHVRVEDQHNICWLKVKCLRVRSSNVSYPIHSYEGRNVDVRSLRNCDGVPKVSC